VSRDKLVEIAEDSARGGFFLFTGNTLSLIMLAIASILVARLLGPENYGLFALSLVVPIMLAGLIDFGVSPALTRFSAKFRAEGRSQLAAGMIRSGLLFKLLIGTAVSAICLVFSDVFATYILNRPEMGFLIRLASLLVLFQTVFTTLNSVFIGLDKMEGNALTMNIQAIAKTILSPLLVVLGFSVTGALAGHIVSYIIASLAGSLILFKLYRGLGKPSKNSLSNSLKIMTGYGFPLYLSALLTLILGQYKTIILAFFTSNIEIGNFTIAITLSNLITVLIFPLQVLFPAFSKVDNNSNDLKKIFELSVKYAALLIVPTTVIVATLSKDIVQTLYGYDYNLAPFFLSLYILTFLYTGTGSIVIVHLFNGTGQTKTVFKYNLISLLVFLPLAPALTTLYAVPGLIIAFLISNLVSLAYGLTIATRKLNVTPSFKDSLKIYLTSFLSATPTLLFLHLSPFNNLPNLIIGGGLYLLTYLTLTPLTRAVTRSDIQNLTTILSKIKILWLFLKPLLIYQTKLLSLIVPKFPPD
jgi:O-antigen/teichoic acid export membrane protein